jgi:Ca2+-binding RTX toxin-like protein
VLGGKDGDEIDAGTGNDVADGGPGADEMDGGEGADILSGGAGDDVISDTAGSIAQASAAKKKGNKVLAGSGADKIDVRNRKVDRVDCGTGRDTVLADRNDKVGLNCERIKRPKKNPK